MVVLCLAAACANPIDDSTITKHDFAGTSGDLAGADLTGADLTGTTDDMPGVGDMSRIGWTDKTFTTTSTLWSVWGDGTTVWAVGDAGVLVKSMGGAAFAADPATKPNTTTALYSIFGVGSGPPGSPLLAAGAGGAIWSYSTTPAPNGAWSAVAGTGTQNFSFVWVAPDGQAFAVGPANVAKKQNGATWDNIAGLDATAFGLWGVKTASGYTVYACGASGKIWKYTGTNFVAENTSVSTALYGIYGFGENDIYAVGDVGVLLHSTGSGAWAKQTVPVTTSLNAVGGASSDEVYAVGDNGVVLHKYDASSTTWTREVLASPTENRNLVGVWANTAQVWVTGFNGAILTK